MTEAMIVGAIFFLVGGFITLEVCGRYWDAAQRKDWAEEWLKEFDED